MNGSGGHSGAPSALGPPLVARGGANMTPDLAVLAETIAQGALSIVFIKIFILKQTYAMFNYSLQPRPCLIKLQA